MTETDYKMNFVWGGFDDKAIIARILEMGMICHYEFYREMELLKIKRKELERDRVVRQWKGRDLYLRKWMYHHLNVISV